MILNCNPEPGGYHLFGFSAHGFALSPIGGRIIADLICVHNNIWPIDAFSPLRFGGEAS